MDTSRPTPILSDREKSAKPFSNSEDHGLRTRIYPPPLPAAVIGLGPATLAKIIEHLRQGYCQTLGYQYNYIRDTEERARFRHKLKVDPTS